jgi:Na+/alanine symporter
MFLTVAIINIVALILLSSAIADVIKSYIKKKKL